MNRLNHHMGGILYALRKELGLSQIETAERLRCAINTYKRAENGKRAVDFETFVAWVNGLDGDARKALRALAEVCDTPPVEKTRWRVVLDQEQPEEDQRQRERSSGPVKTSSERHSEALRKTTHGLTG